MYRLFIPQQCSSSIVSQWPLGVSVLLRDLSSQHVSGSASTCVVPCCISYTHEGLTPFPPSSQMIFCYISLQRSEVTNAWSILEA